MLLDIEDGQLRASIKHLSDGRIRLTLDYPADDNYRTRIMRALSDILRPAVDVPLRREDAE